MTEKTVVILQSSYIPWKGYFDLIRLADEFVLYDDVQYARNDWRNRNVIKTPHGKQWLTIPVQLKGKFGQKINDVETQGSHWRIKHWKTLQQNYRKAPYFRNFEKVFAALYLNDDENHLSRINQKFLRAVCDLLGIGTRLSSSTDYPVVSGRTERLVKICQLAKATRYLSGPSANDYLKSDLFKSAGVELTFMNYEGYPEYRQLFGPFEHQVSILDLLFNEGPGAARFLKRGHL